MRNTNRYVRGVVVACLVLCAIMTVVSVMLMPDFSGGPAEQLQAIAGGGTSSTVSALLFAGSQLPFAIGLVGVAHLLRDRAPRLATIGGTLAVLGGFGHAVYGGVTVLMLEMARDLGNVETHAAVLSGAESGPAIPFMAMGLLGTVLGILLLAIGTWRAEVGPRWVGPVLVAFLLAEFVGTALSDWAGYASGLLFLVGFLALAATVAQTSPERWGTPASVAHAVDAAEPQRV